MMQRVAAGYDCHHDADPKDEHCHMPDKYGYTKSGTDRNNARMHRIFTGGKNYHGTSRDNL